MRAIAVATFMCTAQLQATEQIRRPLVAVAPEYPDIARQARIEGTVTVQVEINAQGRVTQAVAISGHKLLVQSALPAARRWEFETAEGGTPASQLVFVYQQVPSNACWQRTLSRFLPPNKVEVARRQVVPTCLDCGPEKPIEDEICE